MLCCLFKLAVYITVVPILVLILALVVIGVANTLSQRANDIWFSFFITYVLKPLFGPYAKEQRAELFKNIGELKSADPELRKENAIRILEIGTGMGANLSYFPDKCRFISVDPNPELKEHLINNQKKNSHVIFEKIIVAKGEDLKQHLEDESVDVVVIFSVLCNVDDQEAIFREAHRVLVPGGTLFLNEHVRYYDNQFYFRLQQLIDLIWPIYFYGCRITKDTKLALEKSGFSSKDIKYKLEKTIFPLKPQLIGTATK